MSSRPCVSPPLPSAAAAAPQPTTAAPRTFRLVSNMLQSLHNMNRVKTRLKSTLFLSGNLQHMSSNAQPSQPGSNAATRWRAKLRPTLPSSSSAFVFAAHAIMLDNGFTCAGTLSFEPNSAPLPSDWSQDAEAYVFHYQHPRSSPPDVVFVLKVLKLCPPSALPPSIRNMHCVTCCL